MVTKNQKQETITELKEKFSKAVAVYATTQKGLTVKEITTLRKSLKESALMAEYKIAQNTLIKIASKETNFEPLTQELKGPTALLFCYADGVAPVGKVRSFTNENGKKIEFGFGLLEGELLNAEKVQKIANLPSKDVLLSQIAGMLVQPASSIAYILKELGEKEDKSKLLKDFAQEKTCETIVENSGDQNE